MVNNLNPSISFKKVDLASLNSLDETFDMVVHLAAQAGVRVPVDKEHVYFDSNILGFRQLLSFCNEKKIKKVIYASSSSVYDDMSVIPFNEYTTNLNPKSLYGLTKKFNEEYAELNFNKLQLSMIGLRFFSVYGPYGRPDMAYFSFTRSILNGEKITLHNHGNMSRDMTYIDDIVSGIVKTIGYLEMKEDPFHEVFNLGNDTPVNTANLVELIESKTHKKAIIENKITTNESKCTHADLKKSREVLGYNPSIDISQGLDNFLEWYRDYEK